MNPLLSFLHLSPMEEPIILQQWREPGWFLIEHYIITYSIKQREWHSLTRARRKKKTPQNLFVAECCAWETLFSLWFQPSSMHLFKLHRPFSQESSHQQNISDDSQNLKYKLHAVTDSNIFLIPADCEHSNLSLWLKSEKAQQSQEASPELSFRGREARCPIPNYIKGTFLHMLHTDMIQEESLHVTMDKCSDCSVSGRVAVTSINAALTPSRNQRHIIQKQA